MWVRLALVLAPCFFAWSGQPAAAQVTVTQAQLNAFKIMNYYPMVNNWSLMWSSWDPATINSDFALIASLHANVVRVIVQSSTVGYPDPTSTMLNEISQMIQMADNNGLKVQLTLFDYFSSYTDISGSKTWANAVVSPYAGDPRIAFIELQNEISTTSSAAMTWAQTMIPYLQSISGGIPVTVSVTLNLLVSLPQLITALGTSQPDFYDVHQYSYAPQEAYYQTAQAQQMAAAQGKPVLVGETGQSTNAAGFTQLPVPATQTSYEAFQDYFYRLEFTADAGLGIPPAAPWILWDFTTCPSCTSTPAEENYGLYRTDGTAKPAAATVSSVFNGNPVDTSFNNGFEEYDLDPTHGNMPLLWQDVTASPAVNAEDTTVSHSGCCSASISNATGTGTPSLWAWPVANINPSGGSYTASVWVKGLNAAGTTQICIVYYTNLQASNTQKCGGSLSGTTGWQQISVTYAPQSTTALARLYLKTSNNPGTVWFDDVTFEPAPLSASQILTTSSGLAYSRITQSFVGTVTIKNVSTATIAGPFQILFQSLPAGITLAGATGTFNGSSYLTVANTASLAAGQSATVTVQFKDPTMVHVTFTPAVYSGSFNYTGVISNCASDETVMFFGAAAAATAAYSVTIDTRSGANVSGWLDLNFDPGGANSQFATAAVWNFTTNGTLDPAGPTLTGDVSGALPGPVAFDNATFFNDYFQNSLFGTTLSFDLEAAVPAIDSPNGTSSSGSVFSPSLGDQNNNPLLTNDTVYGLTFRTDINLDGTIALTNNSTQTSISPIPEPGSLALLGAGAMLLGFLRLRRK
jgi:hypothetical protein